MIEAIGTLPFFEAIVKPIVLFCVLIGVSFVLIGGIALLIGSISVLVRLATGAPPARKIPSPPRPRVISRWRRNAGAVCRPMPGRSRRRCGRVQVLTTLRRRRLICQPRSGPGGQADVDSNLD